MKIPYGKQWISDDDIAKVVTVLRSDYLTTGPLVQDFERAFADYVGAKHAVAVANGTAALHLAAKAAGVSAGSEVITTPMSFAASANCILYNQGRPVFADITERGLIDSQDVEKRVNEKTSGIIPVHYMGLPCNLQEIYEIAHERDLFVIEDASHALGANYRGTSIGDCTYSDMATFSFHPVKHITTGEGGMITTNNRETADLLRLLRTHGITKDPSDFKTNHSEPWYQEMQHLGFNYRLTDIQAALGLSQLSRIEEFLKRRRSIAIVYSEFLERFDHVETIREGEGELHSYHLYVVKLRNSTHRREMFEFLLGNDILPQIHYIPIYRHPFYRESGYADLGLSNTEEFYERIISLPMYPALSDSHLDRVVDCLHDFLVR